MIDSMTSAIYWVGDACMMNSFPRGLNPPSTTRYPSAIGGAIGEVKEWLGLSESASECGVLTVGDACPAPRAVLADGGAMTGLRRREARVV